jgi:transposase
MASVSPQLRRLKFIDESGVNLGLTRTHGRAQPGQRVVEATPEHSSARYTTIATLGWNGVQAPWLWKGAMNAETFEAYITKHLGPRLRRGDIVVADNLSAHKCAGARAYLEARGIQLVFLPPYSPDFNPIELCWAKVKTALRAAKARTWDDLVDALAKALRSVRPCDVEAWFAHCGYA